MRALPADVAQRLGAVAVDLDPEHVEIGKRAEDLEITLGLGVEIEVEQEIDIRAGAVVERLEMHAQIAQHILVDVELGIERPAEPRPPALRLAVLVGEQVGLERAEPLLAHLAPDRLDAVEIGDRRLVESRVIDAPGGAVRPVEADTVAQLASQQLVTRHAERLGLGVEQRVLDGAHGLGDHAAGGRPRRAIELRVNMLVSADRPADHAPGQLLDHGADAGRAEAFVELAPADDTFVGR